MKTQEKNNTTPCFVNNNGFVPDMKYNQWFSNLKSQFRQYQTKLAVRTNLSILEFYWKLGRDIVTMRAESVWGSGFFNRLSLDFRDAFPGINGFSVTNLKYIKRWYEYYSPSIRQQAVDELQMPEKFAFVPWGHHIEIISHCKTPDEAMFYINKIIEGNWSRRQLEDEIGSNLYGRQGKAINKPIGVATSELQQLADTLPTIEEIEKQIENI